MSDTEPKDQRVPVMMSKSEVRALDAWRRKQEDIPSRGEAVRAAVQLLVAAELATEQGQKPSKPTTGKGRRK